MNNEEYKNELKEYWLRWSKCNNNYANRLDELMSIAAKTGNTSFSVEHFKNREEINAYKLEEYFLYKHGLNVSVYTNIQEVDHLKNMTNLKKIIYAPFILLGVAFFIIENYENCGYNVFFNHK